MKRWSIIAPGSRPSRMGTGTEHQRLPQAVFACARCGTPMSKHRYPLTQAEVDPFHKGGRMCQPQAWGAYAPFRMTEAHGAWW